MKIDPDHRFYNKLLKLNYRALSMKPTWHHVYSVLVRTRTLHTEIHSQ